MFLSYRSALSIISSVCLALPSVAAKDVFAHYMVSGVKTDHIKLDVQQAGKLGFKGFAVNVGVLEAGWAKDCIRDLFASAEGTDFQLFFSLDTYAHPAINDFKETVDDYIKHPNYYKGPDGRPFLSTFGGQKTSPQTWKDFKTSNFYFVPAFDNTDGYYDDINGWYSYWGSVVDGLFSWETAWPGQSNKPSNVSSEADEKIIKLTDTKESSYMMSLSTVQYKHMPAQNPGEEDLHWYRGGETTLPQRMTEILALESSPDLVQVISWNDAGEGHYIGNLWSESFPDYLSDYANDQEWPHWGWQPLFTSFIEAFNSTKSAAEMAPPKEADAIGTMWYHSLLKSANCGGDPLGKPAGMGAVQDAVNWAVVVKAGAEGYKVRVSSGGRELQTVALTGGLNYGSTPGMQTGAQLVELLDGSGKTVLSGKGGMEVTADTNGICNFNYQVAALK